MWKISVFVISSAIKKRTSQVSLPSDKNSHLRMTICHTLLFEHVAKRSRIYFHVVYLHGVITFMQVRNCQPAGGSHQGVRDALHLDRRGLAVLLDDAMGVYQESTQLNWNEICVHPNPLNSS